MKETYTICMWRCLASFSVLFLSLSLKAQSTTPFQLVEPTYDCYSGFITLNSVGVDGTPISYSVVGALFTSPTSNTGVVEERWRIDPDAGPVIIRATQSGISSNYVFDTQRYCVAYSFNKYLLPVVVSPIPDTTVRVGDSNVVIDLDDHFTTRSHGYDYRTNFTYAAYGVPPGITLSTIPGRPPGYAYLIGTPTMAGIYSVLVVATSQEGFNGAYSVGDLVKITVLPTQTPGAGLAFLQPSYDCQTGAFRFNTSGGDGSPIEFMATGITGWTSTPNQLVDRETRTAADAPPITLRARQSHTEVYYVWDIRAQCPVGDPDELRLVAPQYDCASGAFTFRTTGGDSSPVEFMAIGITGWTSNPDQFVDRETRTAADAPPILLKARQHGRDVSYEWNIRAVCPLGSFRRGANAEPRSALDVRVLGNPTAGDAVQVEIAGALDQIIQVQLLNEQGQLISQKVIDQARDQERVSLRLGSPSGVYLLRVDTPAQRRTLKIIK